MSSNSGLSGFVFRNTVIGTPQARWREITQSGRASIMPRSRFWPEAGTNSVSAMACRATSRSVWLPVTGSDPSPPPVRFAPTFAARALTPPAVPSGLSMAMNHCGVLRKMTGFLERQE